MKLIQLTLKISIFLVGAIIFIQSCGQKKNDSCLFTEMEQYYANIGGLPNKQKLYVYKSVLNDSLPAELWFFESRAQNDKKFLFGTLMSPLGDTLQSVVEEILDEGIITRALNVFGKTGKKTKANIIHGTIFPFCVKTKNGVFLYRIEWTDPDDQKSIYTVIKNRRFLKEGTFQYKGKQMSGIFVESKEIIESSVDGTLSIEYIAEEVYLKGIGLVYYKKRFNDNFTKEFLLDTIVQN